MQIKGSPPPRPQNQISTSGAAGAGSAKSTAGAAGADKAKSTAAAAGTQGAAATDGYLPAKQPQGGQNASFVGQRINVGDVNAGRMGCCCPEPPPFGPIGMTPAQFAKLQASIAKSSYDETVRKAGGDGKITDKEQREVNSKGREWKKAETRAEVESAKEAHEAARKAALKDGHISPAEEKQLLNASFKLYNLEQKLKGQEAEDRRMDKRDEIWNNLDGPGGMPRAKGPGGLREVVPVSELNGPGTLRRIDEPRVTPEDLKAVKEAKEQYQSLMKENPTSLSEIYKGPKIGPFWITELNPPFPKLPDFQILPSIDPKPIFCRYD